VMVSRERLRQKQLAMFKRQPDRGGRPRRKRSAISEIVFDLYVLLNTGHSIDAAIHAVELQWGAKVVRKSVLRWRATAYMDRSELTIYPRIDV
jgi:type II secretory pathway component PulF